MHKKFNNPAESRQAWDEKAKMSLKEAMLCIENETQRNSALRFIFNTVINSQVSDKQ